ncbi:MAG: hypothetical protein A3G41_03880 [Elusimicrobia bacterium RIFCSPLOWO2_12_FULL_59_9]|nr:MAG: hypothetical protein A3G41_03880 [Elusimicrobia bacterium RIFCSPLOWO2_12_FULL_59_9]
MSAGRPGFAALAAASALFLSSCGANARFERAVAAEKRGVYPRAAELYQDFSRRYDRDPRSAEALYRAGKIYQTQFRRYAEARALLESAARRGHALGPGAELWMRLAREAVFHCPDYFPMRPGLKWTFVDSETGGKNMTQTLTGEGGESYHVSFQIYAGKNLVQSGKKFYLKENWQLFETARPGVLKDAVVVLKYPFEKGQSWDSRRGNQPVRLQIDDADAAVEVLAGRFAHCLKVREQFAQAAASWKYDYFAPGVGRVLTTVAGPGFEHRNSELLSFEEPK